MTATVDAIYEAGALKLLHSLPLAEHTKVRVKIESCGDDAEREEWLAQSERTLMKVWDNDADDIYNELLAP